jgi:hypothetical protein
LNGARPRPGTGDLAAVGGLLLLAVGIFSRAVFTPAVFYQRDIYAYWYPHIEVFVRAVSEGAWPLWNAHVGFGGPLLADASVQIAYPLTWLNLVMPPAAYYKLFVLLHIWAAGLGLYFLGRRWGWSPVSSFLAATVWSTSGPLLSAVSLFHHFAGAAWITWVLLALEGLLAKPSGRAAILLGATGAGQILAGSGDMCLITGMAVGLRLLVVTIRHPQIAAARLSRGIPLAALAAALALSISAVQWWPTLEVVRSGSRPRQPPSTSMYWSLHPATIVDLLVPRLITDLPLPPEVRSSLFESREPLLACLYLGLSSALLVMVGLLSGGPLRILGGLGFAWFLAAALGHYTPFYPLLLRLPAIGLLRYPVKYAIPTALFWALLVGVGGEAWRRAWSPAERRRGLGVGALFWLLGLALLVAGVWIEHEPVVLDRLLKGGAAGAAPLLREAAAPKLMGAGTLAFLVSLLAWARARGPLPPAWLTAGLTLVVAGDLGRVGRDVNSLAPPELLSVRPPIVDRLRSAPDFRIYVTNFPEECARLVRGPRGWDPSWSWARGTEEMLYPPIGARWGLFGSYDGDFSGLAPASFWPLTALMRSSEQTPEGLRLLQIGNVGHVVSVGEGDPPGLTPVLAVPSAFACPLRLFRVPEPLPRAYVVGGVRSLSDAEALTLLLDPTFDPVREVVLPPGNAPSGAALGLRGMAQILWRRADALELEVEASAPAILVLVEAFGPGWRATVDGQPVEVLKANLLFRAVRVPSGRHRVAFTYRPPSVLRGAALSVAGLLASVAVWQAQGRPPAPRPAPRVEGGPPSGLGSEPA